MLSSVIALISLALFSLFRSGKCLDVTEVCSNGEYPKHFLCSLYNNMNGEQWTNKGNWESYCSSNSTFSVNPCDLYGITCNYKNDIEAVDLANNNLQGQIPDEIFCIYTLKSLYLNDNVLNSTIPESISMVYSSLMYLHLQNSTLIGTIPTVFSRLVNLSYVNLNMNPKLEGDISMINSIIYLREFDASCTNLSGNYTSPVFTSSSLKLLRYVNIECTNTTLIENSDNIFTNVVWSDKTIINCKTMCNYEETDDDNGNDDGNNNDNNNCEETAEEYYELEGCGVYKKVKSQN